MKIVVLRNNLKSALDSVGRAVGSGVNLPILSNVLIQTYENKLKIVSTNLEVGITCIISAKVIEGGGVSVPYNVITGIVSNISSERINIDTKENTLSLSTDNYEAVIQGTSEAEFPIIPQIKVGISYIEVGFDSLRDSLDKIIFSAGESDLRPEINGISFSVEPGEFRLAATDSFRLAEAKLSKNQFKNNLNEGVGVIVPLKTAQAVSKMDALGMEVDEIKVFIEDNQILLKGHNIEVISRLIEGKFPDYQAIIPKDFSTEVVVKREELVNALKLAGSFTSKAKDVRLKVKDQRTLEVYSSDNSLGENSYLIPAKVSGQDLEVVFSLRYLLDGARAEKTDQVYIGLNDNSRPSILKTPGGENYFYILMPVKA